MENNGDRPLCRGNTGKRPCYARDDSEWCANHDPSEAERRRLAGKVRHPRMSHPTFDQELGAFVSERDKIPQIAGVVDCVLKAVEDIRCNVLSPSKGRAMLEGLRIAVAVLLKDRDFAYRVQLDRAKAIAGSIDAPGEPGEEPRSLDAALDA